MLNSSTASLNARWTWGPRAGTVKLASLVIVGLGDTLGVIAVEGKVEESFDDLVRNWNTSASKQCRLVGLCATLGLDAGRVGNIRYQLIHRTASAVYEAKR